MKYIALAAMMLFPNTALVNYKCVIDTGGGRSSTNAWTDFDSLEIAERTIENYLRASLTMRLGTIFESSLDRAHLHCFDEYGENVLSEMITVRANCPLSQWNGNFDCEDFVRTPE